MPDRLKGYRILIVEDEYYLGADLERTLLAEGAEIVGPVGGAEEARSLFLGGHICHVAVLDIKLADGDGYAVADDLARRQIPFVFATGYSAVSIPDRFKTVARWEKPYDAERAVSDLIQILRRTR